jgi:hypothetical protein
LLARRAVFALVGLFDPALAYGDAAQWYLRAADLGIVMELLPDVLTHRRLHADNWSRFQATDSRQEFLHILKFSLDRRRANK